ncbi:endo-1,4-beta-xylanase [Algoriphagus faecimaris]|uniref:Beta-xylanase n=1 Tax=Algoriphagus faecimaris TaxID=686796 RepID=A0A1G6T960_9BACT|nr:endo-1,4-beta-xylanase [Algoriphagus faecimaris]SDD25553.1 endo-1,4-beta-xylanase [Algoriphagus faecimaris]
MNHSRFLIAFIFLGAVAFQAPREQGLKDEFQSDFFIGAAVNARQVDGSMASADSLLGLHFNSLTSENGLKWINVHPQEEEFAFEFGDNYVKKGEEMGAFIVGHTLVWHQQVPDWVFRNQEGTFLSKEALKARMESHIQEVVGRYKGQIDGWDVVNEAFEDDGSWRKTHWYLLMGEEYISHAFKKAYAVDPQAELYYNDYNVWKPEKRKAILNMAQMLRSQGIRIDGIGMQGHYRLDFPSLDQIEAAIEEIHQAGFQVMITELDVDVLPRPSDFEGADLEISYADSPGWNSYVDALPAEIEDQLVSRYASLFKLFKKHSDKISRVTFWGLHDGSTWLNNWPVRGRTNYPLLFDREMLLKKGFLEKMQEEH